MEHIAENCPQKPKLEEDEVEEEDEYEFDLQASFHDPFKAVLKLKTNKRKRLYD
uniref:Uncharacterized protein n=1 Tax=Marseillevirus LCMAC202 TaxID=2506606 RepID=A0A481YZ79_9VIRU|nr:MAG: hypothetical protein LCMAC202_05070 [Marseillevirus LCMAC202]